MAIGNARTMIMWLKLYLYLTCPEDKRCSWQQQWPCFSRKPTSSPTARRGASLSLRWPAIVPTPSTGSDRFHAQETSYIFKSVTNSYISNISVSGLRQELFPDAITAKRSLFDSDHSLPGLLSIHCCFVDLKERVLHIWVGWRWGMTVASVLHCNWSLHCDKSVESCGYSWYTWSIVTNIMCLCLIVLWCPRAMS